MTTCTVNHQSSLQSNTYHIFFNTSKCGANYVISFEVYDDFIGQNILNTPLRFTAFFLHPTCLLGPTCLRNLHKISTLLVYLALLV